MQCSVCGGTRFTPHAILPLSLINEWQLSKEESTYIDRQQGETCDGCGINLRSIALGNAIRASIGTGMLLRELTESQGVSELQILEINEAGMIGNILQKFPGHKRATYPEVDMHEMPYSDGTFDLVVHSDTLEHVPNPVHALTECRRVIKPGGSLCFTVPVVVGRLSRDRDGMPKSYHGSPGADGVYPEDYLVRTEFGADVWTYAVRAGFTDVSIHTFGFPAATAYAARNGWRAQESAPSRFSRLGKFFSK